MIYTCLLESLLSVLLGVYPEVELLDHMVILFKFFFEELPNVFPMVAPVLHSHQQCTRVPNCSTSLPILVFCFLDSRHHNGCKVVFHCGLGLYFPNGYHNDDVEHLFMWLLTICIFSLEKCLFMSFLIF